MRSDKYETKYRGEDDPNRLDIYDESGLKKRRQLNDSSWEKTSHDNESGSDGRIRRGSTTTNKNKKTTTRKKSPWKAGCMMKTHIALQLNEFIVK